MVTFNADFRSKSARRHSVFTVTIATPGVGTLTAHGLATGDAIIPTTTGTLPTGLTAGTTYFAIKIDADTFNFATTLPMPLQARKSQHRG